MSRKRDKPDGLPYRLYERLGIHVYSIGYKLPSGIWALRESCPVDDLVAIDRIRRKVIAASTYLHKEFIPGGFSDLVDAWFAMQEALPNSAREKRKVSTLAENMREAANLKKAFGHLKAAEITRTIGYHYLEACVHSVDKNGNPRPRAEKGNKEIALAHLILEFGIRRGVLDVNPFTAIRKNRTVKTRRLVTQAEMDLAVSVGRRLGGARHIVCMALKTAWLCVKRSVEVRGINTDSLLTSGILWADGKDSTKPKVLVEWSPELRQTIDEALSIKRNNCATEMFIFGNMQGKRYTKGGWKSMLDDLMRECEKEAVAGGIPFQRFSLQDCRPKGVTDKLERGDLDTREVTGHSSEKMIAKVYDRRQIRHAKPAG